MIEARAKVVRSERHGDQNRVWVRLLEHLGGCGCCDEPGGCHAILLADIFKGEQEFAFDDPLGLGLGERVRIVIDDMAPLRAALTSYGLGTIWVLLGAAVGNLSLPSAWADLGAGCGALCGGLLALGLLRRRIRRGVDGLRPRLERDEGNTENSCARSHGRP